MTYKDNSNHKVYNIDFDGTLTDGSSYTDLIPNTDIIAKIRELYFNGNIIIIWSARLWEDSPIIAGWLIQHKVPFHGMMMNKGGTDCYVDDKAILPNMFITSQTDL